MSSIKARLAEQARHYEAADYGLIMKHLKNTNPGPQLEWMSRYLRKQAGDNQYRRIPRPVEIQMMAWENQTPVERFGSVTRTIFTIEVILMCPHTGAVWKYTSKSPGSTFTLINGGLALGRIVVGVVKNCQWDKIMEHWRNFMEATEVGIKEWERLMRLLRANADNNSGWTTWANPAGRQNGNRWLTRFVLVVCLKSNVNVFENDLESERYIMKISAALCQPALSTLLLAGGDAAPANGMMGAFATVGRHKELHEPEFNYEYKFNYSYIYIYIYRIILIIILIAIL